MRETIKALINNTIVFKHHLPHGDVDKTFLSTESDECFSATSNQALAELIYNGLVEYLLGEKHVDLNDLELYQRRAIKSKLRFDEEAEQSTKLKYGFYGEVVLDLILQHAFSSDVLLAKGYFYNPLENSETKGYDAYQFYYRDNQLSLLLGEVKFYASFEAAIKKVLDNLEKATSARYFHKNILALINEKNNFDSVPVEVSNIIDRWEADPDINLYEETVCHGIKLHYPMLILYDSSEEPYDDMIRRNVAFVNEEVSKRSLKTEINIELFFIFIPVESAKSIKEEVIECISGNKPLL